MSGKATAMTFVAALAAASVPAIVSAQGPAGGAERALSPELEALNPPVPDDLVLSDDRRVPAEQKAAAYTDRNWTAPKTSWGRFRGRAGNTINAFGRSAGRNICPYGRRTGRN